MAKRKRKRKSIRRSVCNPVNPLKPGWTVAGCRQLADDQGVDQLKIRDFIKTGELSAFNIAKSTSSRPIWRITREAFEAFKQLRESKPARRITKRAARPQAQSFV